MQVALVGLGGVQVMGLGGVQVALVGLGGVQVALQGLEAVQRRGALCCEGRGSGARGAVGVWGRG